MSPDDEGHDGVAGTEVSSDRLRLSQALSELADVQLELEHEAGRRAEVEALFDLVLGEMSDAVVLTDARGQIWRVNHAASRLVGKAPDTLLGHTADEVFGAACPATPWEVFEHASDGRMPAFESRAITQDRGPVPISVSCSVLRAPTGKVVGAVYAARDLSEVEHLVHQLEQAEGRWRLLAEVGDMLANPSGPRAALPELCRRLAEATGAAVSVILVEGSAVHDVAAWPTTGPHAETIGSLLGRPLADRRSALWAAAREGRTVYAPTLAADFPLLPDGLRLDDAGSAAVVPLASWEAPMGALLVHRPEPDAVTEHVVGLIEEGAARIALAVANAELQEALTQARAEQQAAAFREDMLAAVSHDMQTPLSVLLGSLEALRSSRRMAVAERGRLYDGMIRQATQLRRLVRQSLDFSRLEAGRPIELRLRSVDVAPVLARSIDTVSSRWPVHLDVPSDLPPALVDADRLEQVVTNLLSNATKFSEPGSPITVTARAGRDTIEIVVGDRGVGMSPADLARAFEKFHRGRDAAGIPGTGLGLYMSRALLDAQGGHITISSKPGEGTRFTLVVRRAEGTADGPEGRAAS